MTKGHKVIAVVAVGLVLVVLVLSVLSHLVGRPATLTAESNLVWSSRMVMPKPDAFSLRVSNEDWNLTSAQMTNEVRGRFEILQDGQKVFQFVFDLQKARYEADSTHRFFPKTWNFFNKFTDGPEMMKAAKPGRPSEIRVTFEEPMPTNTRVGLFYTTAYLNYLLYDKP